MGIVIDYSLSKVTLYQIPAQSTDTISGCTVRAGRSAHDRTQYVIKNAGNMIGFTHVTKARIGLVFLTGQVSIEKEITLSWESKTFTDQRQLDWGAFLCLSE